MHQKKAIILSSIWWYWQWSQAICLQTHFSLLSIASFIKQYSLYDLKLESIFRASNVNQILYHVLQVICFYTNWEEAYIHKCGPHSYLSIHLWCEPKNDKDEWRKGNSIYRETCYPSLHDYQPVPLYWVPTSTCGNCHLFINLVMFKW